MAFYLKSVHILHFHFDVVSIFLFLNVKVNKKNLVLLSINLQTSTFLGAETINNANTTNKTQRNYLKVLHFHFHGIFPHATITTTGSKCSRHKKEKSMLLLI